MHVFVLDHFVDELRAVLILVEPETVHAPECNRWARAMRLRSGRAH